MALTRAYSKVTVQFADNQGTDFGQRTYFFDPAVVTDIDAALAGWILALPVVEAVSGSAIASYEVSDVYLNDALSLPVSGVENENTGLISAKLHGRPNRSGSISIPAILPGLMVATSGKAANVVDISDSAVQAFIKLFGTATLTATANGFFTLSDGEHWDILTATGKRVHAKNRNG